MTTKHGTAAKSDDESSTSGESPSRISVLAVSADEAFVRELGNQLRTHVSAEVYTATTVGEAIDLLVGEPRIDCIVSDHDLPETDGVAFLQLVRAQDPSLPFVLFTAEGSEPVASRAISAGVTEYLIKERHSDQWDRLASLVEDAIDYYRRHADLVEPETKAATLLDAARDAIVVVTGGHITYLNASGVELLGADRREALLDRPVTDVLSVRNDVAIDERIDAIVSERRSLERFLIELTRDHGHDTVIDVTASHIEWHGHRSAVLVIRDVTDHRQTETERQRYEEVIERLDDPIMLQDSKGRFQLLNEAVTDYAGLSREELLGEDESLFMDEETARKIKRHKQEVVETGEPVQYEVSPQFEQTTSDATFSTMRYPYYENGKLVGTIAICREVTQLKNREGRLRQYKRAILGSTNLIAAADRDEQYLFANPKYRAYHDITRDDVTELTLDDVLDSESYETAIPRVERALAGEDTTYHMVRTHPDRGQRHLDVHYYPLEDEDGSVVGVVAVMRDVTDKEDRTRQLHVVDRVLRHNVRNEMSIIRGYAERIRDLADGEIREDADRIIAHADDLLTTSEKSRNITHVLEGAPGIESIDVSTLVSAVAEELREEHSSVEVETETPERVRAFATGAIRDAVEELARNAVIHNGHDRPSVELRVDTADDEVVLSVLDDGPGIPEMDRNILEGGRETNELYHGSGLGLWMVYWAVQRSGGSIDVREREPRGSAVSITLPRASLE